MAAGRPLVEQSRPRVSVLDFEPERLIADLAARLRGRVHEAWLFGSLATGTAGPWSDVDLALVADSDLPFVERPREFWDALDLDVAVDLLVYTPAEFVAIRQSDTPFWRRFAAEARRIV